MPYFNAFIQNKNSRYSNLRLPLASILYSFMLLADGVDINAEHRSITSSKISNAIITASTLRTKMSSFDLYSWLHRKYCLTKTLKWNYDGKINVLYSFVVGPRL